MDLARVMPFAEVLGIEPGRATPEEVRARVAWDPSRCTSGGVLHGGVLMGLADSVGGACAFLNLPEGSAGTATIESKTNFLRAVRDGHGSPPARTLHFAREAGATGGAGMRLVTIRTANGTRAGRVEGDRVIELDAPDVGALLADPGWERAAASDGGASHALADADLATLVPRPSKIICLGLNYASHIKEMGHELPKHPTLFAKFPGTLIGARDPIVLPRVSEQVDWEVELGVVVGRRARHVTVDEAMDAIAGYTVVNDVSVRDYQRRTSEFLSGKIFEATTPVGPALVTLDELPDRGGDLVVRCEVDGEVRQESRTSDLLFGPAEIISYVSEIITLEPGDLIATGTPGGVGAARTPPVWLRPGQVVRTVVEGVGECVNRCVPEAEVAVRS